MRLEARIAIGVFAACFAAICAYRVVTQRDAQAEKEAAEAVHIRPPMRISAPDAAVVRPGLAGMSVTAGASTVAESAAAAGIPPLPPPDVVATAPVAAPPPDVEVTQLVEALEPGHALPVRLQALDRLKILGRQGDTDGRIHASLEAALKDPDPQVAVNARDALSELLN